MRQSVKEKEQKEQKLQKAETAELRKLARLYKEKITEEKRVAQEEAKKVKEKEKAEKAAERARQIEAHNAGKTLQSTQKGKRKALQPSTQSNKHQKCVVDAVAAEEASGAASAAPPKILWFSKSSLHRPLPRVNSARSFIWCHKNGHLFKCKTGNLHLVVVVYMAYHKNKLPPVVLQAVLDRLEAGHGPTEIQHNLNVARTTTRRIQLSMEYWGRPYPPACVRRGRPSAMLSYHKDQLFAMLDGNPTAYLDEMQAFLYDEHDVKVSVAAIWRALKQRQWSRKVATRRARERNELLRRVFQLRCQQQYNPEMLVCIDESACNERTGDRKYGWSPVNTPVGVEYAIKRSERWSLLPAMDVDGYIDHLIFQGAINSDLMEEFLASKVLPYCQPWPGKRSVIVLDNASIHHSARICQLCQNAGVILEFLPPYSPDFNPIEQTFKTLKAWLKRNYYMAETFEHFEDFLEAAVQLSCYNNPAAARGYFRLCGWRVGRA